MNVIKLHVQFLIAFFLMYGLMHGKEYGGQSMVAPLKKVLVRKPDCTFGFADPSVWHYTMQPNFQKALDEHEAIVKILQDQGVEVVYHDNPLPFHADAIFVHDPAIITDFGAIILQMGKEMRRGEEQSIKNSLLSFNIPILCELSGAATAEGGDMLWITENILAIGRGFRTNQAGIDQIRAALQPFGVQVLQFDLPYDQGPEACLHLQSLISFVDYKKAVVYLKYLPVAFLELLQQQQIDLLLVPDNEYFTMAPNILAIKPNVVLMLENNVKTIAMLQNAGCIVYTYQGNELSLKAEGGATCLTRPLLRE